LKIEIHCKWCHRSQTYSPRDPNNLSLRPHTKCKHCGRWIYIKKRKLKTPIKQEDTSNQLKAKKLIETIEILKKLKKGYYAQQIAKQTNFSPSFLSKKINLMLKAKLIKLQKRDKKIPKFYNLNPKGKFLIKQQISEEDIIKEKNREKESKLKPRDLLKTRCHKLRFKDHLIYRPSWLSTDKRKRFLRQFRIKKIDMNNWKKYILYIDQSQFSGIASIEVNLHNVVYNFKKDYSEQIIASGESIENYIQDRKKECLKARDFLKNKGFKFTNGNIDFAQKPHLAFETKQEQDLASLGKYLTATVKKPAETIEIDDSPKTGGEEETDSIEKAQSVLDLPEDLQELKEKVEHLGNRNKQLVKEDKDLVDQMTIMSNEMTIMSNEMTTISKDITSIKKMFQTFLQNNQNNNNSNQDQNNSGGMII